MLQPYLLQHDVLGNVGLACEDRPRKNVAILGGRLTDVATKQAVLKEVVVYRDPPAVHVFDVESHGRRFMRTLVFTSSPPHSLHCLPAAMVVSEAEERLLYAQGQDSATARRHSTLLVCAGRADAFTAPRSADIGPEQHIPSRHLYGLLPTALLEQYTMWQASATGVVVGTLRNAASSPTELRVKLLPRGPADAKGFGRWPTRASSACRSRAAAPASKPCRRWCCSTRHSAGVSHARATPNAREKKKKKKS